MHGTHKGNMDTQIKKDSHCLEEEHTIQVETHYSRFVLAFIDFIKSMKLSPKRGK